MMIHAFIYLLQIRSRWRSANYDVQWILNVTSYNQLKIQYCVNWYRAEDFDIWSIGNQFQVRIEINYDKWRLIYKNYMKVKKSMRFFISLNNFFWNKKTNDIDISNSQSFHDDENNFTWWVLSDFGRQSSVCVRDVLCHVTWRTQDSIFVYTLVMMISFYAMKNLRMSR